MSERNQAIVRRSLEEVYNAGRVESVDELVSKDFVAHMSGQDVHGPEEMKGYVWQLRQAFPDLHLSIDDQVAEGDKVVTRWTATGTQTGPFQGIAPTGRRCTMSGIDIDYVIDGKTVECWSLADTLSLLQQLGAIPAAEPASR